MRTSAEIEAVRRVLGFAPGFAAGGPPPHGDLSVRSLSVLARCPKEYEHRYLLRTPKPAGAVGSTPEQAVGRLVHRALYEAGKRCAGAAGSRIDRKSLRAFLDDACAAEKATLGARLRAWEILRPVVARLDFEHAVAFEEPVRADFGTGVLWGQVDRLDDRGAWLEIWDYKTGEDVKDEEATAADPQVRAYLLALSQAVPGATVTFRTWYLVPDLVVTVSSDPEKDAATLAWLRQKRAEVVTATTWTATPGRPCDECPWAASCGERADALRDELGTAGVAFFAGDDAALLAERQRLKGREELAAFQRKRLDEDYLRPRLAGGRKVIGGGLVAGLRACRARKRYPAAAAVAQALADAGLDGVAERISGTAPLDHAAVERALRALGDEAVERSARQVMESLAVLEDEGGSYVEIRRS